MSNDMMLLLMRLKDDTSGDEHVRGREGDSEQGEGGGQAGQHNPAAGGGEDLGGEKDPGDNDTQGPDGLPAGHKKATGVEERGGEDGLDVEECDALDSGIEEVAGDIRSDSEMVSVAGVAPMHSQRPGESAEGFMLRVRRSFGLVQDVSNESVRREQMASKLDVRGRALGVIGYNPEEGILSGVPASEGLEQEDSKGTGTHGYLNEEVNGRVREPEAGAIPEEAARVADDEEYEVGGEVENVGPKGSRNHFYPRSGTGGLKITHLMTGRKQNFKTMVAKGFFPENPAPQPDRTISREGNAAACGPEIFESSYDISPFLKQSDPELVTPSDGILRRLGGKKQLAAWLVTKFPDTYAYVEPFGGSMKVLLTKTRRHKVEIVNDIDPDMIHYFYWARHAPEDLCDYINSLPCHEALALGSRQLLAEGGLSGIERAAAYWMGYQTGFNAMVSDGRYGSSVQSLLDTRINRSRMIRFQKRMLGVDIRSTDYRRIIASCNKVLPAGSYPPGQVFFYLDPPYDQTEGYSTMKGKSGFGWPEQSALADLCVDIHMKGNLFIQTNSSTKRLKEKYSSFVENGKQIFHMLERKVHYSVSGKSSARGDNTELIISNFPVRDIKKQGSMFQ